MSEGSPRDGFPAQGRSDEPEAHEELVYEQSATPEETSEPAVQDESKQTRERGFLGKLFNKGADQGLAAADPRVEVRQETVLVPLFGSGLTREEVLELNSELAELFTALDIDSEKYFNRTIDEFKSPVDFYEDLGARLDADGQDVDISETLSTRLGDDHPLVVELRRREALEDVRRLDDFLKEGIGEDNAAKVFLSDPGSFRTPLDYYQVLQGRAEKQGLTLVPLIIRMLGADHPLPMALGGDVTAGAFSWQSMKKATFKVPEPKPVPEPEVVETQEPGFGCMACIVYWFGLR